MRHNKKINHLGRTSAHRKAMLANMACSLIENKRISTTVAKAKALRTYIEPLITKAKDDSTHSRRVVFSYLKDKNAVSELFREIANKIADRPGGYTRILKTGSRLGDNADMCIIELVDFNETMLAAQEEAKKPKRRRSRRSGSPKKAPAPVAETETAVAEAEEAPEEVVLDSDVVEETESVQTDQETQEDQPVDEAIEEEHSEETSETESVEEEDAGAEEKSKEDSEEEKKEE